MIKRTFTTVMLALAVFVTAAQPGTDLKQVTEQVKQQRISLDSTNKNLEATMNNMKRSLDSLRNVEMQKQAQRSGAMMLQWHKERQAKQKKQLFMYLGLGILFLGVLIFGLMRKGRARKIS
jgi:hypothetical protein